MNRTAFLYDEKCFWHVPPRVFAGPLPVGGWVQPSASQGISESPETKRRFRNLLEVSGLLSRMQAGSAVPASEAQLVAVHPKAYLDAFKHTSDTGGGSFGANGSSPVGAGTYEIAALSTGLAIRAMEMVLDGTVDNAYALSRPPGHHTFASESMGMCYLANIAIAVESAIKRFDLKRVVIVDWDVHHGNGTQSIFYERPDVLTISLHQDGCFPPGYSGASDRGAGAGAGYNLNIPLPAGSGETSYLRALDKIVRPALAVYKPEIIVVACGYDANAFDPYGRMLLSSEAFRSMTKAVADMAEDFCNGRLACVHEGGYSEFYVPFCGVAVVEELVGVRSEVRDPMADFIRSQQPSGRWLEFLDRYVDDLAAGAAVG